MYDERINELRALARRRTFRSVVGSLAKSELTALAIEVRDVKTLMSELRDAGVEFSTTVIEGNGIRQAFTVRDGGSGMMYEFIERRTNDGTFTDKSVQELFDQLERNDSY